MGRPPIGKKAMTGAERVRRYREKHAVTKPVTKQNKAEASALVAKNERLRAACAEKDREIAALKQQAADEATVRLTLHERIAVLEKARAAKPAQSPDERDDYVAILSAARSQIKSLRTQLRNKTARLEAMDHLMLQAVAHKAVFASAEDRRFVLGHFHPDRFRPDKKPQAERVFQLLNNLPVRDR